MEDAKSNDSTYNGGVREVLQNLAENPGLNPKPDVEDADNQVAGNVAIDDAGDESGDDQNVAGDTFNEQARVFQDFPNNATGHTFMPAPTNANGPQQPGTLFLMPLTNL